MRNDGYNDDNVRISMAMVIFYGLSLFTKWLPTSVFIAMKLNL
jgi:hypothetical protein